MIRPSDTARRLHLAADGMTARSILEALADRLVDALRPPEGPGHSQAAAAPDGPAGAPAAVAEVVVDVTNAWSIPWTAQPVVVPVGDGVERRAYVRHKGFRWRGDRVLATYEITT